MNTEDKQLLLKDLCARLPYKVMVECSIECGESIDLILSTSHIDELVNNSLIVKPYLRPISSMTDEERNDFYHNRTFHDGYMWESEGSDVDWLNAHHFDYRGLIPMGLALEAPKDMYKLQK